MCIKGKHMMTSGKKNMCGLEQVRIGCWGHYDALNCAKRGSVARIHPASKAALLNNWVEARALLRTWSEVKLW